MVKWTHYAAALAVLFLFSGCGGINPYMRDPKTPEKDTRAIVYGHIDMEDADTSLQWFCLKKVKPITKKPYVCTRNRKGTFYWENLEKGSYVMDSFGGTSSWPSQVQYSYNMPRQVAVRLVVAKPGFYFMGSYKYIHIEGESFFDPDSFSIERVDKPTEKELLTKILPFAKKSPVWQERIQKRLGGAAK